MKDKRVILICGHYGSGKTNIAVSLALDLKKTRKRVALADMDIVNPYFRSKESEDDLQKAGINFICSEYANTNLDMPALPQEIYAIADDREQTCVLDIGGDDRGALVLGRISGSILEENSYEMCCVINKYRPMIKDAKSAIEIMDEIEAACKIPFTALINNSNLCGETTPEDVLSSAAYAEEISALTGLPVIMTTVTENLLEPLKGKIDNLYPIKLQKKY